MPPNTCWDCALKDLGWDYGLNPQQITARYDACKSPTLVNPGGAFVASRLLLIKRVGGSGNKLVAHALRTLPQRGGNWTVKGWNNALLKAPDGVEFNFLDYMEFENSKWKNKQNPEDKGQYEIKLLTKKDVPKGG